MHNRKGPGLHMRTSPGVTTELACQEGEHWLHFRHVHCDYLIAVHEQVGYWVDLTCLDRGQPAECACRTSCNV